MTKGGRSVSQSIDQISQSNQSITHIHLIVGVEISC